MATTLQINGKAVEVKAAPDTPLLWVLRDELGLTGSKYGCGVGQCGACTVLADNQAIRSCSTPISVLGAAKITTIEGLGGEHPVQVAWRNQDVPQCGYCQSGQIMGAVGLLNANPKPSDDEIIAGMEGNICRCGCYQRIREAIKEAAGLPRTAENPPPLTPAPAASV